MKKPLAAVSWSGGKDSCLALHRARKQFDVRVLVTMFTEDGRRSRSHGLRPEILQRQAELLGLALVAGRGSWQTYEAEFKRLLTGLRDKRITDVIFGDIFLDAHREWVERVCRECGLQAHEPLWGESTTALFHEILSLGAEVKIVTVRASLLDENWLGRMLDASLLPEFAQRGVDPCGENGEYHTLVTNFPDFRSPLRVREVGRLIHGDCWTLDLLVDALREASAHRAR